MIGLAPCLLCRPVHCNVSALLLALPKVSGDHFLLEPAPFIEKLSSPRYGVVVRGT